MSYIVPAYRFGKMLASPKVSAAVMQGLSLARHVGMVAVDAIAHRTRSAMRKRANTKNVITYKKQRIGSKMNEIADSENYKNLSLRGGININSDEISYSTTVFPAGRKMFSGSSYDRQNCRSATVSNNGFFGMSAPAGRQTWTERFWWDDANGAEVKGADWEADLPNAGAKDPNRFPRNLSSFAASQGPVTSVTQNPDKEMFEIVWAEEEYQLVNLNTHPCVVTFYDIMPKDDGFIPVAELNNSASTNKFLNYLQKDLNVFGGNVKDIIGFNNIYNPAYTPIDIMIREPYKHYRIHNITQIYLKPGMRHIHRVKHRKNWVYDLRKYNNIDSSFDTLGGGRVWPAIHKFQSTRTVIQAKGLVGYLPVGGFGNTTDTQITVDGCKIACYEKIKFMVREHIPFQEKAYIDLSSQKPGLVGQDDGPFMPGFAGFGGTISRDKIVTVEEDDPSLEPGVE